MVRIRGDFRSVLDRRGERARQHAEDVRLPPYVLLLIRYARPPVKRIEAKPWLQPRVAFIMVTDLLSVVLAQVVEAEDFTEACVRPDKQVFLHNYRAAFNVRFLLLHGFVI